VNGEFEGREARESIDIAVVLNSDNSTKTVNVNGKEFP